MIVLKRMIRDTFQIKQQLLDAVEKEDLCI